MNDGIVRSREGKESQIMGNRVCDGVWSGKGCGRWADYALERLGNAWIYGAEGLQGALWRIVEPIIDGRRRPVDFICDLVFLYHEEHGCIYYITDDLCDKKQTIYTDFNRRAHAGAIFKFEFGPKLNLPGPLTIKLPPYS